MTPIKIPAIAPPESLDLEEAAAVGFRAAVVVGANTVVTVAAVVVVVVAPGTVVVGTAVGCVVVVGDDGIME